MERLASAVFLTLPATPLSPSYRKALKSKPMFKGSLESTTPIAWTSCYQLPCYFLDDYMESIKHDSPC
ncbi:hypothetical protein ACET3Z_015524 [Daucus carota]